MDKQLTIMLIVLFGALVALNSLFFLDTQSSVRDEAKLISLPLDMFTHEDSVKLELANNQKVEPVVEEDAAVSDDSPHDEETGTYHYSDRGEETAKTSEDNAQNEEKSKGGEKAEENPSVDNAHIISHSNEDPLKKVDQVLFDTVINRKEHPKNDPIEVIVELSSKDDIKQLKKLGYKVKQESALFNYYVVELPGDADTENLIQLGSLEYVKGAYNNEPLDLQLSQSVPLLDVDKVWLQLDPSGRKINGTNVTIAILDTGFIYNHTSINCTRTQIMAKTCPSVIDSWDFFNNTRDVFDYENSGHGTHVAGIAGMSGKDGLKGVAPGVRLALYKVCMPTYCRPSEIIPAIERAMDPNQDGNTSDHYDIITMSIGGLGQSPDHPNSQAINAAFYNGTLVLVSAGNYGAQGNNTIACPSCAKEAISVGASTKQNTIWSDSSLGYYSYGDYAFSKPNVVVPGHMINSSYKWSNITGGCVGKSYLSTYCELSGTSMSSPMVAGVAALLKQAHPAWNNRILKSALTTIADDIGFDWRNQGGGKLNATKSNSINAWFNPIAAEFGNFRNISNHYYNQSILVNVTSLNDSSVYYDISIIKYDSDTGYSVKANTSSITLAAGSSQLINITLDFDYNLTSKDFHGGYIRINSSKETYKIPWLFKKEGDYLNHPPVADAGLNLLPFKTAGVPLDVTLNGTASYDLDVNDTLTYNWSIFMGSYYALDDRYSPTPTFNVPATNNANYSVWKLTVCDGKSCSVDYVDVRLSTSDFDIPHASFWKGNFSSERRLDNRREEGYYSAGTIPFSSPQTGRFIRQPFTSINDTTSKIRICSKNSLALNDIQNNVLCMQDYNYSCKPGTVSDISYYPAGFEVIATLQERCSNFFDYTLSQDQRYLITMNVTDIAPASSWPFLYYLYQEGNAQTKNRHAIVVIDGITDEIPQSSTIDSSGRSLMLGVYESIGTDAGKIQTYNKGDLVHLDFPTEYDIAFQNITSGADMNSTGYWQTDITTVPGDYIIRVNISNSTTSDYRDVTVRVIGTTSVPVIQPISDYIINETDLLTIDVNATDVFSPLYYYINDTRFSHPGGLTSNTFTWTSTYSDSGNYSFMVNVSNGMNQSTANFNVGVLNKTAPANTAPVINNILASQAYEGENITLFVNASDADSDPLNYTLNDSRFIYASTNTFVWSTANSDAGTYSIKANVSDGTDSVVGYANVSVKNVFTLRLGTANYESYFYNGIKQDWISPSTISVDSVFKTATPAAEFSVKSDNKLTMTNSASGWKSDIDYIFLDNLLPSCSGSSCSFNNLGYSTSCARRDATYYDCKVSNAAQIETDKGYLYAPSQDKIWYVNYLVRS